MGDVVSLTGGTASFSDKTVANGKTVTLAGASLSGIDAGNYVLDSVATATANITALHITGSFTADNKEYDGNDSATVLTRSLSGAIGGDTVSLTGGTATFSDKNVANGKTVTLTGASLSGADAGNYVLYSVGTTTANITAVTLTAAIIGDPARPYNGNTTATLTAANFLLTGVVGTENFTVTQTAGTYNSANVATATTVTASLGAGDFTPAGGAVASNYVLPTTASGAGHITAVTVTASILGNPTKPYEGNTTATLASANFSLSGLVGGDGFTVTQTVGTYNSKDVATANTVTASLSAGDFTPGGGSLASNYVLPTTASGAGHITKTNATVAVTLYTCPSTTYTGLPHTATVTSITGVNGETGATVGTVDVSHTTHTDAGTYASDYWFFTGTANYNDIGNTTITDCIAKADAVFVVTPYNLTYNGQSHTATITSITGVNGETGAIVGTVDVSHTTHTNAGTYSTDYWFLTGTANYNNIGNTTIPDTIIKAHLTETANDKSKTYDNAPFTAFTATLSGFVNGETDSALRGTGALSGAAGFTGTAVGATLPGTYTITPTQGTLSATNYDFTPFVDGHLTIGYGTCSGSNPGGVILPPINSDGSSVYQRKGGSTIPVKFTVCDANGNPISDPTAVFAGTGGQLTMLSAVRGQVQNVNETGINDIPDVAFRYAGGIWIFNMATNNLDAGTTYTFRINLKNGSGIQFRIATK
jgi:hypothetical protein